MTLASEAKLTARETEVLALLARGRTIGYVADELVIAQNTAKGYVKNVYAKLGIHSRQELHRRGRGALSADVVAAGLMTFCAREVPPHAGHAPAPAGTSAPQLLHTTATLIENISHLLQCVQV